MTGLSETALTRMRTQFAQFLPDTATLQAKTITSDGAGGWTETWQTVSGGVVACRLDVRYRHHPLETVAEQPITITEYMLTVPFDAPLEAHQRAVINGEVYQVRTLLTDHSWRVAKRAYITQTT